VTRAREGLVLLVGLLLGGSAWAQTEPAAIVDAYWNGVLAGDSSAAFDTLMAHSHLDALKPREIELLKGQIQQAFSIFGAPSGYEMVSRKPYGSSVMRLVYVTKHRDLPLVWNFYFYQPTKDWQLVNLHFNDQLQNLD
jgi:hypothetical protein